MFCGMVVLVGRAPTLVAEPVSSAETGMRRRRNARGGLPVLGFLGASPKNHPNGRHDRPVSVDLLFHAPSVWSVHGNQRLCVLSDRASVSGPGFSVVRGGGTIQFVLWKGHSGHSADVGGAPEEQ